MEDRCAVVENAVGARPLLLHAGECIRAAQVIEAADDADAVAKANELILRSDVLAIEVWQRTRFVGRHTIAADVTTISGGRGAA